METPIKLLHTYDTEYSADSIEWCPIPALSNFFVCGTYQLEDPATVKVEDTSREPSAPKPVNNKRKGRILLFDFDFETESFELKQQIDTAAVLDQKWHCDQPYLAIANSIGEVLVFHLNEGKLYEVAKTRVGGGGIVLALSLDWDVTSTKLVVSDSKGGVSIVNFDLENFKVIKSWHAHGFEAWTCAFDKWNSNVVYTGGDDAVLNAYDLRCPTESPQLKWKNNSQFAGVTNLLSFKGKEFMLASGSYDERMRMIDTRLPKTSVSDLNLKGGIWRMRVNPWNENKILVACMYHNFSFVDIDEKFSLSVADKFEEHSSICYGCDWSYKQGMKGEQYFATCSFYDHKMCICSVESK